MSLESKAIRRVPNVADRCRCLVMVCSVILCAWLCCVAWVLAAYQPVQDRLCRSLAWSAPLSRLFPTFSGSPAWLRVFDLSRWSGGDAHPFAFYLVEQATLGITIAPVESSEYWGYPVWMAIAIYQVLIVWAVRELFQRRGARFRTDLPTGHLFWARWPEFWTAVVSGVMCIPLFALWRIERGVWEASFVTTPAGAGAWVSVEMWRGALLAMLVQIAIIHWLIVWHVHRRSLARDRSPVRSRTVWEMARCPWCGYEAASERCSECGADRNDPRSLHPRVWIPWIENRAWARWVFRTPTALGAIVFLFFSPVWVPAIRMGVRTLLP